MFLPRGTSGFVRDRPNKRYVCSFVRVSYGGPGSEQEICQGMEKVGKRALTQASVIRVRPRGFHVPLSVCFPVILMVSKGPPGDFRGRMQQTGRDKIGGLTLAPREKSIILMLPMS